MATPSEEKARREVTYAALVKLTTGQSLTRRELFEHPDHKIDPKENWQYELLRRLRKEGIMIMVRGKDARHPEYMLAKGQSVDKFLDDEQELTRLLWPFSSPPPPVEEEEEDDVGEEEDDEGPEVPAQPSAASDEGLQGRELSDFLVKYIGALVENTIYMREKMDAMHATLNAQREEIDILYKALK